jgi:Asp-tRNA(Asn)/Glu-tRNA(Gln) amidotransferase B subunit
LSATRTADQQSKQQPQKEKEGKKCTDFARYGIGEYEASVLVSEPRAVALFEAVLSSADPPACSGDALGSPRVVPSASVTPKAVVTWITNYL